MEKTQKLKNTKTQNKQKIYNLEERIRNFFERVIKLCKKIKVTPITRRQIDQLIGAAGSVGANYLEASEAMSRKDFNKGIKIARKEAKESRVWLHGLKTAVDFEDPEFEALAQEAKEFVFIFTSILEKTDKK